MRHGDIKEVSVLYKKVFDHANVGEKWTNKNSLRIWEYWSSRKPNIAYVVVIDKKIVGGFIGFIVPWWNGNHLRDCEIFVDPRNQNRGLGAMLLKTALNKSLSDYKASYIIGMTFNGKKFPLSWYESIGFEKGGPLTMVWGNPKKILRKINNND